MIKLVHITDLHFANKPPVSRIDDYNDTLFKKLKWVVDFANKKKVDGILLGGDIWHTHQPNPYLLIQFIDILSQFNKNIYYIWGNHDVQGGNTDHIDRTTFGFLKRFDKFIYLHDNVQLFEECVLGGYDYSVKEECQLHWPFPGKDKWTSVNYDGIKVLLTHPMITRERSIIIEEKYRQVNYKEITTDADIMLLGHYHGGIPPYIGTYCDKDFTICNPGSFGRVNAKEALESIGPALTYITIDDGDTDIEFVKIPTLKTKEIFDLSSQARKKRSKRTNEDFKDSLIELSESNVMGENFVHSLSNVLENPPEELEQYVHHETIELCKEQIRIYSGR